MKKLTDVIKPEKITVAAVWETVAGLLFRGMSVSDIQYNEMRRSFYMGFTECFAIMSTLSEELSEEDASKILERLNKECLDFHHSQQVILSETKGPVQ